MIYFDGTSLCFPLTFNMVCSSLNDRDGDHLEKSDWTIVMAIIWEKSDLSGINRNPPYVPIWEHGKKPFREKKSPPVNG